MGAFGPAGEVRVKALGRYPERFRDVKRVFVGEGRTEAAILHRRPHGDGVVLRLEGVNGRDQARELFGTYLYVPEDEAVKLPSGEYFVHQIVGLRVVTDEGQELGTVREVLETGSNDVYVVRGARSGTGPAPAEVLLPAIKDVVKRIDLERGTIEVTLLPGLID
jgi:16S rRNA processing protein RimM